MQVMETQIGFMLGGCAGEGVTTGINLSESDDEQGKTGSDTGETGDNGDITEGQGTEAADHDELIRNIAGHAQAEHFPGETVDEVADITEQVIDSPDSLKRSLKDGRTAYYNNGVVVIVNPNAAHGGTVFRGKFKTFLNLS